MSCASPDTQAVQTHLLRAQAMTMIVFPLRRLASPNGLDLGSGQNGKTLLDLSPEIFRLDELDATMAENVYGHRAERLKRVEGLRGILPDDAPNRIEATLDCFILRGKSHADSGSEKADRKVTDFFIAFATFDQDNQAVGEIAQSLHRQSGCTKRETCSNKGHFGLCLEIRNAIIEAVQRVAAGPAPDSLSFTIRGDGNFALKLKDGIASSSIASPSYLPQRGRAHALAISRSIDADILKQTASEAESFRWSAGSKAWVVAKPTTSGLPNKLLSSPSQRSDGKRQITFFNDLTIPVLLAVQQAFAIEELRIGFSLLCTPKNMQVLALARQSRLFARNLLNFRNSTWVTTLSISPELTDYLNAIQQSLRLRQSYDSLMDDFAQWTSHLELVAQAEQSAMAERNALFLTVLSICLAVGALCFEQGTTQAVVCSIVAILSASVFLVWQATRRIRRAF